METLSEIVAVKDGNTDFGQADSEANPAGPRRNDSFLLINLDIR